MTGQVVVVGSVNVDVVVDVRSLPAPGETVLGRSLRRLPGGKGANQAVAAAAAGAAVALVGAVGDDADGAACLAGLGARGIDVSGVRLVARPTGTALVVVADDGENAIVVVPGANGAVTADDVRALPAGPGDVLLLQLEIPTPVVEAAVRHGAAAGARVVLNVAPAERLAADVLDLADPVLANEHEARALGSRPGSLVVTLGERGARWERAGLVREVPAPRVAVRDTTGAGDTFAGALAAALARGAGDDEALAAAVAAAAESVTTPGAQGGWTL